MRRILYFFPLVVILLESLALKSSLLFAQGMNDYETPLVNILGFQITIGGTLPYDAVPNLIFTLHALSFFMGVVFFAFFALVYEQDDAQRTVTEE